jgi:hypothetical protein
MREIKRHSQLFLCHTRGQLPKKYVPNRPMQTVINTALNEYHMNDMEYIDRRKFELCSHEHSVDYSVRNQSIRSTCLLSIEFDLN